MTEQWAIVSGFPEYMVSSEGRVYSWKSEKFLRPGIASNGYPTVALGRKNTRTLHSLVAEAFMGPCPAGMEVRHRDGNRANPMLSNLIYGTRSQNVQDAYDHGTRSIDLDRANGLKAYATRLERYGIEGVREQRAKGGKTEIDRHGPNARKKAAKKTVSTKNEKYGETWGTLGFSGISYSKTGKGAST